MYYAATHYLMSQANAEEPTKKAPNRPPPKKSSKKAQEREETGVHTAFSHWSQLLLLAQWWTPPRRRNEQPASGRVASQIQQSKIRTKSPSCSPNVRRLRIPTSSCWRPSLRRARARTSHCAWWSEAGRMLGIPRKVRRSGVHPERDI